MKIILFIINYIHIYFYLYSHFAINKKLYNNKDKLTLVVCVYNENIYWIHKIINYYENIYIYIKNYKRYNKINKEFNYKNVKVINEKNIGSCDHIFLKFIINNYYKLPKKIFFCKGTEPKFNILDRDYTRNLNNFEYPSIDTINEIKNFNLKKYDFKFNKNTKIKFISSNYKNFKEYCDSIFLNSDILFNNYKYIIYGGYFIVSREQIHNYSINIYKNMIDNFTLSSNREIDHYHERLWGLLFTNSEPLKLLLK